LVFPCQKTKKKHGGRSREKKKKKNKKKKKKKKKKKRKTKLFLFRFTARGRGRACLPDRTMKGGGGGWGGTPKKRPKGGNFGSPPPPTPGARGGDGPDFCLSCAVLPVAAIMFFCPQKTGGGGMGRGFSDPGGGTGRAPPRGGGLGRGTKAGMSPFRTNPREFSPPPGAFKAPRTQSSARAHRRPRKRGKGAFFSLFGGPKGFGYHGDQGHHFGGGEQKRPVGWGGGGGPGFFPPGGPEPKKKKVRRSAKTKITGGGGVAAGTKGVGCVFSGAATTRVFRPKKKRGGTHKVLGPRTPQPPGWGGPEMLGE